MWNGGFPPEAEAQPSMRLTGNTGGALPKHKLFRRDSILPFLEVPRPAVILPIAVAGRLLALWTTNFLGVARRCGLGRRVALRPMRGRLHVGRASAHGGIS